MNVRDYEQRHDYFFGGIGVCINRSMLVKSLLGRLKGSIVGGVADGAYWHCSTQIMGLHTL